MSAPEIAPVEGKIDAFYEEVEGAYGRFAPDYDQAVGMNAMAARGKAAALTRVTQLSQKGSRLLDIGCGPGHEATVLARRGYRVLGVDSAAEMVELARERAEGLSSEKCDFLQMRASEIGRLADEGRTFDGAYSFYAVLNLEPRLDAFAQGAARLLPEGAPLVIGLLNPTVFFELVLYPFFGRLKGYRKASQRPVRLKVARGGAEDVACYLYPAPHFARLLAPWFNLESTSAVHLFLPPPDRKMLRFPTLIRGINRIEARLEARRGWRSVGYFSLLTLRRTAAK